MTGQYRLYIVTDTPAKAAEYFFGHGLDQVPAWTKIVSTIPEISAIPDGARAVGVWFVPFDLRNEAWILRRCEVKIIGDHFDVLAEIRAWQTKKALTALEPETDPVQGEPAPQPEAKPEPEPPPPVAPPAPPPARPAMQKPAAPRWT
ncbi:hypothetical protein [Rhizobium sp. FKY42]|uniref:hypothetical protein n=1 Tax=Rhizobium sp. FKY42 TaxID=2562310 RepID=UPI0010C14428|nr:hypothetical protein [Rhizobium sp. FKY42]